MSELYEHTATRLAELIRARQVSSREVVEAHLARIEEVNGYLGAVTRTLRDTALAAAEAADRSEARGPLHGVPFSIKENIDCLGSPTTHGVPALREALPYADAVIVLRLKQAGAIPIARTNLSEMGMRLCTINPLHGRTLNPYDRKLTVGGSSGGDAAAVATGMVPLGIGGDIGGSLRIPAECCGTAALKPTPGRIPITSSLEPRDPGLSSQAMLALGPLARSVADLKTWLSISAGRDARDPRSVDVPLEGPPPSVERAALVTELPGAPLPAATVAAIEEAGGILREAGWEVEHAVPPELLRVDDIFGKLLADDLATIAPQLEPVVSRELFDHFQRLCRSARFRDASAYRLHTERSRIMRRWSEFFREYPVVIGPCWARPFWPVDADVDPERGIELLREATRFIVPGSALGLPAVVLTVGTAEGLPTSIQIYADLWREDLCLHAAERIEANVGVRRPMDPVRVG